MKLVLQYIAPNGEPGGQRLTGRFDERGGTLGRSEDATLSIPDPQRVISRLQARILYVEGSYWIENVSATSQLLHNEKRLIAGMRATLQEGDEVKIGGYAFLASLVDDQERTMMLSPEEGTLVLSPEERTTILSPQDRAAALSLQDRTVMLSPQERTAMLSPQDRTVMLSPQERTAMLSPQDRTVTLSPQERKAALGLERNPRDSQATPRQPPQSPPKAQTDSRSEVLWRSFLEGAGIESPLPDGPSPEVMREIGEALRTAVAGLQSLIAMRAKAKNEMHADMTLMQARDNNPLKFSPDVQLALEMILRPSARGFLSGSAVLRDAVTDLQSHQIGMTAGMEAAMEAVVKRFDPARIEALPPRRRLLERLSSVHRRAHLWELYADQYNSLREESWDNFERCFVEALREGYETEVRSHDTAFDPPGAGRGGAAK